MKVNKRMVLLLVMVFFVLALPSTALANKKIWFASISSSNEVPPATNSHAKGSAFFGTNFGGGDMTFGVQVQGLTGAPTRAHIHFPAAPGENAPVEITLCGTPTPAAVAVCPFDSSTNSMTLNGTINSNLLFQLGITSAEFFQMLDSGLAYVNVHTAMYPGGEARGQIYPR